MGGLADPLGGYPALCLHYMASSPGRGQGYLHAGSGNPHAAAGRLDGLVFCLLGVDPLLGAHRPWLKSSSCPLLFWSASSAWSPSSGRSAFTGPPSPPPPLPRSWWPGPMPGRLCCWCPWSAGPASASSVTLPRQVVYGSPRRGFDRFAIGAWLAVAIAIRSPST